MWADIEQASDGKPTLLLVDDDPLITETLAFALGADFEVHACDSRPRAIALLRGLARAPQLALVDLGLPPTPDTPDEGFQLIADLLAHSRSMKIFVLSGQSEEANARHARALGAADFLAKPCSPVALKSILLRAADLRAAEIVRSRTEDSGLVGRSAAIVKLKTQLAQFANAPFPVLVTGEPGSGKTAVALALHRASPRAPRPLLAFNCAATATAIAEAALFGYAKGAFAGAAADKPGIIEDAQDGTLVLDAVGELPPALQGKLLRVLESGEYERVGEAQPRGSRARIVAATSRDLRLEVRRGAFREDLYHRLSVYAISVPPLRDREADKLPLLEHFRSIYGEQPGAAAFALDDAAQARWCAYRFPGNVRELRNIVVRLVAKHAGRRVTQQELEDEFDLETPLPGEPGAQGDEILARALRHLGQGTPFNLDGMLQAWEHAYLHAAVQLTRGNMSQAAKMLGVNRTTLYSRMQSYTVAGEPHGGSPAPLPPVSKDALGGSPAPLPQDRKG